MIARLFERRGRRDLSVHAVSFAATDVGSVRALNEDRFLDRPDRALWAVADGMGGHVGGAQAAERVIAVLDRLADAADRIDERSIASAVDVANTQVRRAADPPGASGATLAGAFLSAGRVSVFWMGDSRVYRWRAGALTRLTRDHSLVQELVDAGSLSPDRAATHPMGNVVTRAVGAQPQAECAFAHHDVLAGDRLLLCSDGLTGVVADERIAELAGGDIDGVPMRLIGAALGAGAPDNVTIVAADIRSA